LATDLDWFHTDSMMKRIALLLAVSAMAFLFSQPASAQFSMPGLTLNPDNSRPLTPEEKEKLNQIDQDYKATLKKVPDKNKPYDPWAGARDASSTPPKQQR
jgi:hypothetical protein